MSTNNENKTTAGSLVIGLALWIPAILIWGLATRDAWNLFVVPVFVTLPTLTLSATIGIRLAVAVFTTDTNSKRNELDFGSQMFVSTVAGALSWGFVHLVHWVLT